MHAYIRIYIYTGSWNNMVYLQWNDSHLINCFAMLQWNSKSGKLSIFVTNSYCSPSPLLCTSRYFEIPSPLSVHFPRIRSRVLSLTTNLFVGQLDRKFEQTSLKKLEGKKRLPSPDDRSIDSSLHTSPLPSPPLRDTKSNDVSRLANKEEGEEGR